MDLREIGWKGGGCNHLEPLAGFCEHGYERCGSGTAELVSYTLRYLIRKQYDVRT
jgi:hypothetical protein